MIMTFSLLQYYNPKVKLDSEKWENSFHFLAFFSLLVRNCVIISLSLQIRVKKARSHGTKIEKKNSFVCIYMHVPVSCEEFLLDSIAFILLRPVTNFFRMLVRL